MTMTHSDPNISSFLTLQLQLGQPWSPAVVLSPEPFRWLGPGHRANHCVPKCLSLLGHRWITLRTQQQTESECGYRGQIVGINTGQTTSWRFSISEVQETTKETLRKGWEMNVLGTWKVGRQLTCIPGAYCSTLWHGTARKTEKHVAYIQYIQYTIRDSGFF